MCVTVQVQSKNSLIQDGLLLGEDMWWQKICVDSICKKRCKGKSKREVQAYEYDSVLGFFLWCYSC